ncbi:MAG: leucine--tRNA ligase [Myxococcales bacterium]|nr:leucine--tRNA ligase [Myxococcales bacterium]
MDESRAEDRYDPATIEPKWQRFWEEDDTFRTPERPDPAKKLYVLDMFPYPSGAGLHVGHPEGYTATDILCRAKRAQGRHVLHPMGWDAFGLPAEQHAIKTGTHPAATTAANVDNFRRQLKMLGFSYDWSREVDTTDPAYVRWTQWIFLQLFRRGLAYQDEVKVNWCAALGTVLSNEEVIDGKSERGAHPVVRVPLRQWVLKITAYADRLLAGLDDVEWPSSTRTMQREWIGRSEGAEVVFAVKDHPGRTIEVFTTRPDTLFGATFMVLAPEHPLVEAVTSDAQRAAVETYVASAKNKSDLDRQASKEKSGVFTGGYAINPVSGAEVPIWIADYVLMGYGTGAIMAVPAHDTRDFEFAKTFDIPIIQVVAKEGEGAGPLDEAMTEAGVAVNSGRYDGMPTAEVKAAITADLERDGKGKRRVETKLRDWVFSRQRYWGEPFPIYFPVTTKGDPRRGSAASASTAVEGDDYFIHYDEPIAVEESELPVRLPELDDFQPGDDPAGVLARAKDWRFFQRDGRWLARETNTMPQWAGSCWYYLRFCDPHNDEAGWSPEAVKTWLPVDLYVGGAEHAVLHLLYARFWHMVLYDEGLVPVPEPFTKLVHQGIILGEIEYTAADGTRYPAEQVEKTKDGRFVLASDPGVSLDAKAHKMSKARGNVVNPDDIVKAFGADALRCYEMFMGPLEASKPWNTDSIHGVRRFLERAWRLAKDAKDVPLEGDVLRLAHKTIAKVTSDIDGLRFNTAISAMMVLSNELQKAGAPREGVAVLAQLLHPFAPHLGEEMWEMIGREGSIQRAAWPQADPALLVDDVVEVPVQINGKKRGVVMLPADADEAAALEAARADEKVAEALAAGTLRKTIWVPGRILNLIVK